MNTRRFLLVGLLALCACGGEDQVLVVFNAGSLARPMRAALDTFAARENVGIQQESAGSLESARKLTELGKIPDLIALADAEVFPQYLEPVFVDSHTVFARNRMVVAFTDRSRFANEITTANWMDVLTRDGVEVGRADPNLDPNGYRTLMVWQLAALARNDARLPERLEARASARNVRPKEADLIGLLEAGELDYIWSYESMAKAIGFRYVTLGDSFDLATRELSEFYGNARVVVTRAQSGDLKGTVTFTGQPIVYAFAVPLHAPNRALGLKFAAFLLSDEGRAILRREGLDAF